MARVAERELLLALLDQAYNHRSWHGTNLRGSIRGLTVRQVVRRPGPRRHNIWENVVHCAYWKYAVWRRITGTKRGSFGLKGSNWFTRPDKTTDAAWRADVALLDHTHHTLRALVASLSARDVSAKRGTYDVTGLITGIAAHDLYHAGQIQLLKKLVA